jgi:hypothetical protein
MPELRARTAAGAAAAIARNPNSIEISMAKRRREKLLANSLSREASVEIMSRTSLLALLLRLLCFRMRLETSVSPTRDNGSGWGP